MCFCVIFFVITHTHTHTHTHYSYSIGLCRWLPSQNQMLMVTVVSRSLISVLLFLDGHFFKINADGHLVMVTVVNCSTFLGPCSFQFQMATFSKINADGHQVTVSVVNCSRLWVFSVVNCPVLKCLCSNCTATTYITFTGKEFTTEISCSSIFIKTDRYCCSTSRICKQVRAKTVKTDQCHKHTSVIKSNRLNHKMETGLSTLPSNNSFSKI